MTNTFFTSDTHFGHARIIELSNRPFEDVDHMNTEIVRRWNEIVQPDDVVFHLGDVALGRIDDSLPIVSRLNGYKVLMNGNHDRPFMNRGKKRFDEWNDRYREVFDEILPGTAHPLFMGGHRFIISHFPYDGDSHGEERYREDRPVDKGKTLIHGHTHMDNKVSFSKNGTKQIHVGMDAWDFRPVSQNEIMALV